MRTTNAPAWQQNLRPAVAPLPRPPSQRVTGFLRELPTQLHVQTKQVRVKLLWVSILLAHLTSAGFLFVGGLMHLSVYGNKTASKLMEIEINPIIVLVIYVFVGWLHFYRVLQMALATWRERELAFGIVDVETAKRMFNKTTRRLNPSTNRRYCVWLTQFWNTYMSTYGRFGIYGHYGDVRIGIVEWMTICAHTVQGYHWSMFIPPWTNVLVGSLIALECMYPAMINTSSADLDQLTTRSILILLDMAVDIVISTFVPLAMVLPIFVEYSVNWDHVNFNYSEAWYAQAMLTLQRFTARTSLDLLTKIGPFLFNYSTLIAVSTPFNDAIATLHRSQKSRNRIVKVQPLGGRSVRRNGGVAPPTKNAGPLMMRRGRWLRSLRLLRCAYGVAFMVVVVYSSGVVSQQSRDEQCAANCLLKSGLWFSWTSCPCIALELNCAERAIEGDDSTLENLIRYHVNPNIVIIIFNQCPHLVVPPAIQQLHRLLGIHVYNSAVDAWNTSAAVTSEYFERISYVLFVRTNLTELPAALLTPDLPSSLNDIEIIGSRTPFELPGELPLLWAHVTTLYFEDASFTSVPRVLLQMPRVDQLSLAHNDISVLPDDVSGSPLFRTLRYLLVCANPSLPRVPESWIEEAKVLVELYADATNVSTPPSLPINGTMHVSLADTPLCAGAMANTVDATACAGLHNGIYEYGAYPLDPRGRDRRRPVFLSSLIS